MANIGAKNVYRIFAGGNHSWVVIDDIVPIKRKYRPPSPVPDNKGLTIIGGTSNQKQKPQPNRSNSRGKTSHTGQSKSANTLSAIVDRIEKDLPSFGATINLGNQQSQQVSK